MPPWSDRRGLRSVVLWWVLWVVLAAVVPGASADVLPLQAIETEQRLRENPQAFDRADQFCSGRRVGDACQMPASALAGGGAGICRNGIDSSRTRIDLHCERTAKVSLARGLPSEGFVLPAYFCETPEGAAIARSRGFSCTPAAQPPPRPFLSGSRDRCRLHRPAHGRWHAGARCRRLRAYHGIRAALLFPRLAHRSTRGRQLRLPQTHRASLQGCRLVAESPAVSAACCPVRSLRRSGSVLRL